MIEAESIQSIDNLLKKLQDQEIDNKQFLVEYKQLCNSKDEEAKGKTEENKNEAEDK